jgi:hypothetical protein
VHPDKEPTDLSLQLRRSLPGRMRFFIIGAKVEYNQPTIIQDALKPFAQILSELSVVIQPPESWPAKDYKARRQLAQAFEFADRRRVVQRRPPVLAISLYKWDRVRGQFAVGTPLVLVDENDSLPVRPNGVSLVSPDAFGVNRDPFSE